MKKLFCIGALLAAGSLYAADFFFSDVVFNFGYIYNPQTPLGFNIGLFGFDLSVSLPAEFFKTKPAFDSNSFYSGYYLGTEKKSEYTSEPFAYTSLTYGIKIFGWLRIPVGISLYANSYEKTVYSAYYYYADGPVKEYEDVSYSSAALDKIGFNMGVELLVNPFSDTVKLSLRANAINFQYFFFGIGLAFGHFAPSYRPPPPAPRPQPSPPPAPAPPPPAPVSGTVYYSYNGIGYVYFNEGVFYLCSDGRPVGYVDAGVIFAFGGRVLGFYENAFIYDRNGNPVGADDPKRLGTDAAAKRSVTKAGKQALPVKQPKQSVTRPRLKNGYFGGSLQDIF
jgi:hypothetical protein